MAAPLVIGIGNDHRGDDGAGLAVAARLEAQGYAPVARCQGDLTTLMELWRGHDHVRLVDMVRLENGNPGAIHRFDLSGTALPYTVACSSHGLSVAQAVELARALGELPVSIELIGIVGARTDAGAPMTKPVAAAVEVAACELLEGLFQPARAR